MNSLSRDALWGHMVPGSALREPLPSWGPERKPKWPVRGDHVEQIPGPDFGPGQGGTRPEQRQRPPHADCSSEGTVQ